MSDLQDIRNRIHEACVSAGRKDIPELVAVSKMQALEKMMLVYEEGQRVFGENYVQELVQKKAELEALGVLEVDLHFIGHLQTNKVRQLVPHTNVIHSIDSLKLLNEVANRSAQIHKKMRCYFEVNIDLEESKGGFRLADFDSLARVMGDYKHAIIPMGLMCIPDPNKDVRQAFSKMKQWSQQYSRALGSGLSMGMSSDFEIAILEGATSVRVGSAIFGARPMKSL
jgi:PLP dependent protein